MLKVARVDTSAGELHCLVLAACTLGSHKRVAIAGSNLQLPFLTPKDVADVEWAVENAVNYISASFTRTRDDVVSLKALLSEHDGGESIRCGPSFPSLAASRRTCMHTFFAALGCV